MFCCSAALSVVVAEHRDRLLSFGDENWMPSVASSNPTLLSLLVPPDAFACWWRPYGVTWDAVSHDISDQLWKSTWKPRLKRSLTLNCSSYCTDSAARPVPSCRCSGTRRFFSCFGHDSDDAGHGHAFKFIEVGLQGSHEHAMPLGMTAPSHNMMPMSMYDSKPPDFHFVINFGCW